ncbi:hypothetical protein ACFOU2_13605 [Bacillus songklensis]|uniref:DUF2197 domain-containing protein n=1 Tax=Bacillus songklensis TaxID=1069116 RepID=A0ABV8B2S5_9BACI
MIKRCEICGKLKEQPDEQTEGMAGTKGLYVCEDCRRDRRKSMDKVVTQ